MTALYVVLGIVVVGLIVYYMTGKKKGKGPTVPPEVPTPPSAE
jgi:hypothetical protein